MSPPPSATTFLDALVAKTLDKDVLHSIAEELARLAMQRFASQSDEYRKQWCCSQLTSILTHFGNADEVLGVIADLPLSARVQKWATRKIVEHALLKVQEQFLSPPPTLAPVPVLCKEEQQQQEEEAF